MNNGAETIQETVRRAPVYQPPGLQAINVADLLRLEIPPRECLLSPILREKETAMIHGWRGTGKTHFALGLAYAVATGGSFLRWRAPRARRVLYLDGELPARVLQDRLRAIIRGADQDAVDPDNLRLIAADLQECGIPSLARRETQELLEPMVAGCDLVFLDSISTLGCSVGAENDAESWLPTQEWALKLRRQGKSVVFIHHDGKSGSQRGTSRREDILDLVIALRKPSDHQAEQGARFEIHFPKARSLTGNDVKPFEARLDLLDDKATWTMLELEDAQLSRLVALIEEGCKVDDISTELKVSRPTVFRLKKKAKEKGLLE